MIVVIVGPTGVGKTTLSIALAKALNSEIISGDSVQVYRGLDIGSAKITETEKEDIEHHMIDILDPRDDFSVALYQRYVRQAIEAIEARGKTPIIVGGTGYYIKSVLHDFDFTKAQRNPNYEKQLTVFDNQQLHKKLFDLDPASAEAIHPNNRKRVIQALYRAEKGVKRSAQTKQDTALYDYCIVGLTMPKDDLYQRIDERVERMFHEGLVYEVKRLYDQGIRSQAVQAIGYKELYKYFDNEITLAQAKETIKRNSRRFAKRQYTYFKHQFKTQWFTVNTQDFTQTVNEVIAYVKSKSSQKN